MSLNDYAASLKDYPDIFGPLGNKIGVPIPSARKKRLYIAGSLRNELIVKYHMNIAAELGPDWIVFSDWAATHPHADDMWRDYYKARGFTYKEALKEPASINVFEFDKKHIDQSDAMLVVYPAGKSAHLELGYHIGRGKPGFILLDDPERWDVMLQFATGVTDDVEELINMIQGAHYG